MFKWYKILKASTLLNQELLLIGSYPPPVGGIAVHIQRLLPLLEKEKIEYLLFNHFMHAGKNIIATNKKYGWWLSFFFYCWLNRKILIQRRTLLHVHLFVWLHYLYLMMFSWFITPNLLITVHDDALLHYCGIRRWLTRLIIKLTKYEKFIVVSDNLYLHLHSHQISTIWLPATIPITSLKKRALKELGYEGKTAKKIVANMYRFTNSQIRQYGMDVLFKAMNNLKQDVDLFIFVSDGQDREFERELILRWIPDLMERIFIIYEIQLIEYLHNFDVYVRPNREDGFGLGIVDAMMAGIPAIASDVCARPEDAILFKNEEYIDLREKIQACLDGMVQIPKNIAQKYNHGARLVNIYKEFLQYIK